MRFLAGLAVMTNKLLLGKRAKIPGLFIPARLHARCSRCGSPTRRSRTCSTGGLVISLDEALSRSSGKSMMELTNVESTAPREQSQCSGWSFQDRGGGMSLRIAYMTGEYPRATDTFIQREVAAMRQSGIHVQTLSVRKPPENENVGPEQQAELLRTRYLVPPAPGTCSRLTRGCFFARPKVSVGDSHRAIRPPRRRQAAHVASGVFRRGGAGRRAFCTIISLPTCTIIFPIQAARSRCWRQRWAASPSASPCTGRRNFFEPKYWRIDEKIRRALFVCCISHFCRSQAMIFSPQSKWDRLHVVHCGVDPLAICSRQA